MEEEGKENAESGAMEESSALIEPMEENVTSPKKAEDIQKEIHSQLKKSAQQQVVIYTKHILN